MGCFGGSSASLSLDLDARGAFLRRETRAKTLSVSEGRAFVRRVLDAVQARRGQSGCYATVSWVVSLVWQCGSGPRHGVSFETQGCSPELARSFEVAHFRPSRVHRLLEVIRTLDADAP